MNIYFNINYEFDKQKVHRAIEAWQKGYIFVADGVVMNTSKRDSEYLRWWTRTGRRWFGWHWVRLSRNGLWIGYISEGLCFNETIHATRVVTAHIRYLEHYRHFLWYQVGNKDEHSDAEIEIQKIIVNKIFGIYWILWQSNNKRRQIYGLRVTGKNSTQMLYILWIINRIILQW